MINICKQCGKRFYVSPSREWRKYCCQKCYGLSKKGKPTWNKGTKGLCKANKTSFKKGQKPWNWTGGKKTFIQNHARAVMENKIGRKLTKGETVHHINEIKKDNRIENLQLYPNRSEHMKYHMTKGDNNEQ